MAQIPKPIAHRVDIIEYEHGGGIKVDDIIYFDNEDEARNYVQTFNIKSLAPDWYMVAEYRGLV